MPFDVGRAGAGDLGDEPEPPHDQSAVGDFACTDDAIDAFPDEIHQPVALADLQNRLREVFETRREKTMFIVGDPSLRYGEIIEVIDAAKGIESQTLKLFEVCRLRDIPIITFINKVDREGLAPLDLIDEIQGKLALDLTPVLWPIGQGVDFKGYIDLLEKRVVTPQGKTLAEFEAIDDLLEVESLVDDPVFMTALETLELARAMLPEFDL